ncbi:MAG: T9SS type A sorting domain-containing protein [Flavobacteriaceae bacterium]|nr:T9SS type A sorting domain-containing protein [Flavobacteriaceae bacterium]
MADLTLYLEAPDDTFITMIDGACTSNDDIDATFTDAGTPPGCAGIPAITGNVAPDQPLATFSGLPVNGNWQFYVNDPWNGDNGSINTFRLEICSIDPVSNVPNFVGNMITVPGSSTYVISIGDMNGTSTFAPTDIQYILLELPALGDIVYNGVTTLGIGDTFSQQDINTGLISYVNTHVCGVNANDQFRVDVLDTNTNGWVPNQTIPILIDCALSTDEFSIDNISLWPNPTNGDFNIQLTNSTTDNVSVSMYDIQGREVYTNVFEGTGGLFQKELNLGNLSSGVYLFNIEHGNKSSTKKIIINR